MKKKIIIAVCLMCAVVCGVIAAGVTSRASSANISIAADGDTVKKEQEFSVRVTVSSDAAMQNIDTMFTYDATVLEYVSSDSSAVAGASGMIHIMEEFLDPVTTMTYTLNFKALELGTSVLSVSDTYISQAETFDVIPVSSDSISVEVVTNHQESSETRLDQLLVAPGELNEPFSPDVYEYTAQVAYEDENAAVSAIPMDENAVVTMEKSDTLSFGENRVIITVTAPSGDVGTYTVIINRPSAPETETETFESETPESETMESETMTETQVPESETESTSDQSSAEGETGESQAVQETGESFSETETGETVAESAAGTQAQSAAGLSADTQVQP